MIVIVFGRVCKRYDKLAAHEVLLRLINISVRTAACKHILGRLQQAEVMLDKRGGVLANRKSFEKNTDRPSKSKTAQEEREG